MSKPLCSREDRPVTSIALIRHAEPLMVGETPAAARPLTEKGRNDARVLGTHLTGRSVITLVWASPERRARESAALAFPLMVTGVRDQLSEVKKPWYASADELENAVAKYLNGEAVEEWEPREDVIARIAQLKLEFGSLEGLVLVSHGLLLTTWLHYEIGLDDPFRCWSNLRIPDAWEFNLKEKSLERIL